MKDNYIETEIETEGIPDSKKQPALFLISPDTNFSTMTPVIIGTNILTELQDIYK